MTLASLDAQIARESASFDRLNGSRHLKLSRYLTSGKYDMHTKDTERLIIEHAMTLARLRRFRSYLAAKEVIGQA